MAQGSNDIGTDASSRAKADRVVVVHGRNEGIRDAMFTFLGALGLKPIEWDHAVAMTGKGSPYVGEVLDAAFREGQAVVVVMTPDDMAYLRDEYASSEDDPEKQAKGQARPNVLFEAGMAMGRNEDHTILVEFGDLRPFSDVGGRHTIRMNNTASRRKSLAQRLQTAGCTVDMSGDHWLKAGDFTTPVPGGGLPVGKRMPSTGRRGPSVDAHWYALGGNKLDKLTITNGPVELNDVTVGIPEEVSGVQLWQDSPVKRLPAGKSFSIRGHTMARSFGSNGPDQFELTVIATLDDGSEFRQNVFIDSTG